MEKLIKDIPLIFNIRSLIIVLLSLLSTWLCVTFEIYANFPLDIYGALIIFPIIITTYSAFERREKALMDLSDFKTSAASLYLASRDWLKPYDEKLPRNLKKSINHLFSNISAYLFANRKDASRYEEEIFKRFSEISKIITSFHNRNIHESEFLQLNFFFEKLILSFSNLKNISEYRSSSTLRALSKISTALLPILYGPFFAYQYSNYFGHIGYLLPMFVSFVLICLNNVQEQLEYPYDQIGEDDLSLEAENFEITG